MTQLEQQRQFTPRPFGRYYLIDKLAVGGMAEVFRAVFFGHSGFEMHLVLKRILPELSAREKFVEMFVNEAKIYVELRHQNIVQIYDFGRFNSTYFIAMEAVEGKDLRQMLLALYNQEDSLPPSEIQPPERLMPLSIALYIVHELCKGLAYAHSRSTRSGEPLGVVHRDITPANVLLSYAGEVKLADFGIAKALQLSPDEEIGVLKGKYEYMSPEQACGGSLDHRSDIFALGILLYELCTGTRLFKSNDDEETLRRIRECDFKAPIEINSRISPRLNQIILTCLQQNPSLRFQNTKALQHALRECIQPFTIGQMTDRLSKQLKELFETEQQVHGDRYLRHYSQALSLHQQLETESIIDGEEGMIEPLLIDTGEVSIVEEKPAAGSTAKIAAIAGWLMALAVSGLMLINTKTPQQSPTFSEITVISSEYNETSVLEVNGSPHPFSGKWSGTLTTNQAHIRLHHSDSSKSEITVPVTPKSATVLWLDPAN